MPRRNLATPPVERWQPPPLGRPSPLRTLVDLQLASILKDLRPILQELKGTLLDAGCGGQPYRHLIPSTVTYQGLDTVEAKNKFGYSRPDTMYVEGNKWPISTGTIDAVLCTEVLEHTEEPAEVLQEISRCLRTGGRLIMTVPLSARWHFIPFDYWRFTPSGVERLLNSAGFENIVINSRGNPTTVALHKIVTLVASYRWRGIPLLPIAGIAILLGHLTLRADWGDDCLGYTVCADKA